MQRSESPAIYRNRSSSAAPPRPTTAPLRGPRSTKVQTSQNVEGGVAAPNCNQIQTSITYLNHKRLDPRVCTSSHHGISPWPKHLSTLAKSSPRGSLWRDQTSEYSQNQPLGDLWTKRSSPCSRPWALPIFRGERTRVQQPELVAPRFDCCVLACVCLAVRTATAKTAQHSAHRGRKRALRGGGLPSRPARCSSTQQTPLLQG